MYMIISINEVIKSRLPVGLVNLHCVQYFMSYECKKFNMKWDSCVVAAALRSTATGLMFPPNIKLDRRRYRRGWPALTGCQARTDQEE